MNQEEFVLPLPLQLHLPENDATRSALEAPSDHHLRVPCYCEENVYRLVYRKLLNAMDLPSTKDSTYYVVFVSSATQCVPMLHQRAKPNGLCFWDYHVLCLQITNHDGMVDNNPIDDDNDSRSDSDSHSHADAFILDMDSTLPYPCPMSKYLAQAFPPNVPPDYAPLFRVVSAQQYLCHLTSDRRHMILDDGTWGAPPPNYACIQQTFTNNNHNHSSSSSSSNLDEYRIMMTHTDHVGDENGASSIQDKPYGIVMTQQQLARHFLGEGEKGSTELL